MNQQELKQKLLNTTCFIDNEYLDRYCKLILINKDRLKDPLTTQSHHIIPSCIFKALGLRVDDSKNNRVNLLYKDHVLAHYYLSKSSSSPKMYAKLFSAVLFLIRDKKGFKEFSLNYLDDYQKDYEDFKKSYFYDKEMNSRKAEKLRGQTRSPEVCFRISESNKGREVSLETRSKISKSMKNKEVPSRLGTRHSKESKDKISKNNKGKPRPETSVKLKGKPKSESHKLNMSISHTGKIFSESHMAHIIESQNKRDKSTRAYKYIYYYDNKKFLGQEDLLRYLNSQGFRIGATALNLILKNNSKTKYYKDLYPYIIRERSNFNYKNENKDKKSPKNDQ